MMATLLVHFGSPRNASEVRPFLKAIFQDNMPSIFALPLSFIALRRSLKKYGVAGFGSAPKMETLAGKIGGDVFVAAQYGPPSIEDILEKIDSAGFERVQIIPLYPHASIEMYDSLVERICRLNREYYRNVAFTWAGPFFDHPLFIEAWGDSIAGSLGTFQNKENVHIIYSAHAIQIPPTPLSQRGAAMKIPPLSQRGAAMKIPPLSQRGARGDLTYHDQVECTAKAVSRCLDSKNPMSVAYQSGMKFGKWSRPSLDEEILRLARDGVKSVLIAPVSFLFDNVETLFDIGTKSIPAALGAGLREARYAPPPGDSFKIAEMLRSII